jgi:hypothetical protein
MSRDDAVDSQIVCFRSIHSDWNNKCTKKIMIWTRIYSGSKINLPIMIGRTRVEPDWFHTS